MGCQGRRMGDKCVMSQRCGSGRGRAGGLRPGCSLFAAPASAQSLTDRFKSLFGGKSDEPPAEGAPPAPAETQSLT